jgi:hypothetical protein
MRGGGSKGEKNSLQLHTKENLFPFFPNLSLVLVLLVYRFHPLGSEHDPIVGNQGPTIVQRHKNELS